MASFAVVPAQTQASPGNVLNDAARIRNAKQALGVSATDISNALENGQRQDDALFRATNVLASRISSIQVTLINIAVANQSYTVPVVAAVATPDLSMGGIQLVILTADTTVVGPLGYTLGANTDWILILRQNSSGGHSAKLSGYIVNFGTATPSSPLNTECRLTITTDQYGVSTVNTALIDQQIA